MDIEKKAKQGSEKRLNFNYVLQASSMSKLYLGKPKKKKKSSLKWNELVSSSDLFDNFRSDDNREHRLVFFSPSVVRTSSAFLKFWQKQNMHRSFLPHSITLPPIYDI